MRGEVKRCWVAFCCHDEQRFAIFSSIEMDFIIWVQPSAVVVAFVGIGSHAFLVDERERFNDIKKQLGISNVATDPQYSATSGWNRTIPFLVQYLWSRADGGYIVLKVQHPEIDQHEEDLVDELFSGLMIAYMKIMCEASKMIFRSDNYLSSFLQISLTSS